MRRIIKKKFNISVLFYVICAIMIVIIIPCAADIFEDMYRINGRMSGYEEDSLYQDFIDGSYDRLLEKTEYNIGIHLQPLTRKQLIIMCMSTKANMPKQNRS